MHEENQTGTSQKSLGEELLWAYKKRSKNATKETPFCLAYGIHALDIFLHTIFIYDSFNIYKGVLRN